MTGPLTSDDCSISISIVVAVVLDSCGVRGIGGTTAHNKNAYNLLDFHDSSQHYAIYSITFLASQARIAKNLAIAINELTYQTVLPHCLVGTPL